jgi:hypothetical protein
VKKAQIKGTIQKAAVALVIVLMGCNTYLLVSMGKKQKETEARLMAELEKGRAETEKALAAQEEKIKETIALNESNIRNGLSRIEKTIIVHGRLKSGGGEQSSAGKKDTEKELRLLYDEAFLEAREEEAYRLLKEEKYGAAYKLYDEIVEKDPERLLSRYYRVYSLFYSNEMNREKYDYLLKEIEYLRGKGMDEDSFKKIEAFIGRERGITNEGR